jgi:hypothetical protein
MKSLKRVFRKHQFTKAEQVTPEGYSLGAWQNAQRRNYKKGKLSPDRIERLEDIGFKWNPLDEQFERGLQETLHYRNNTGSSYVPYDYRTPEGYSLGVWQYAQRRIYKKGKLSSDRIKRLEDIGFKWGRQR